MLKFVETKSNEPRLTQKEIPKQVGYSDSTIKRYRDDINMDKPYNRQKRKKNTKSTTSITETETHTPGENTKKNTRDNKKND